MFAMPIAASISSHAEKPNGRYQTAAHAGNLPCMTVPIGHGSRVQLHPIDLTDSDADDGPIRAKQLRHEPAARQDVPEFMNVNAADSR